MTELSRGGGTELGRFVTVLMRAKGNPLRAQMIAEQEGDRGRIARALIQRSAVGAIDSTTAQSLVDERTMSAAWLEGQAPFCAFDRMLADGAALRGSLRAPVYSTLVMPVATAGVPAGAPMPVTRATVRGDILAERNAPTLLVISEEQARAPNAQAYISRQMRRSNAAAVDAVFLPGLVDSSTPTVNGSGSTAAEVLADMAAMLALSGIHAASALYWIVGAPTAASLSVKATNGQLAFPDMTPKGGTIAGIPVLVTERATGNSPDGALLVDASGLVLADDGVLIDASDEAAIVMDTDPGTGEQELVSLFQTNSVALRMERRFGFQRARDNAVVLLEGCAW